MPVLICEVDSITPEHLTTMIGKDQELGKKILGTKGMVRVFIRTLKYPATRKYVTALKAKTGRFPEEVDAYAYIAMSVYLERLKATGGDACLNVLRPAILKLEIEDTSCGPFHFSPT